MIVWPGVGIETVADEETNVVDEEEIERLLVTLDEDGDTEVLGMLDEDCVEETTLVPDDEAD